ncbi:hypothetical protein C7S20_00535 [Christiangramia fulva]|uniref:5'-Nucleotidase C-terminal domain-containing protein n=1 Tax=Christiangramia fulva TaxID=2126553 RepID=A0A2R3Z0T8_9FLAO|nr:5'-nucleotidase [Christiangramia fulva]AVR43880.1 hypothetical protein C7S20_00535 [Christiangramia fulva]
MKLSHLFFGFAAIILMGCKNDSFEVSDISAERIPVNEKIQGDTAIQNFIKPYKEHLNNTLDSALIYNPKLLNKSDGDLNSALGNFMADVVMEQANPVFKARTGKNIDFVLLNKGGIRAELPKGNLTARNAYELMPFENEIVIAELSGKKVKEMLDYLSQAKSAHPVSGIKLTADKDYKIIDARIHGKEIDTNKTYFVATSDYLQQGGDSMNFFKDPVNLYGADYKIRNAIIDYFKKHDTLKAEIDDRYTRQQ